LTDSLFFDTDCLSAFLWVGNEDLLVKLYPGKVMIPQQVYNELSSPRISNLNSTSPFFYFRALSPTLQFPGKYRQT